MKKLFVVFIALAMVGAFSLSAAAADWSFYGSSRMTTFWDSFSTDEGDADDDGLTWALQGNSRIGANVKADNISGRFEYGSGPNLRILWGEWDTGAVKLGFGQNYSPVNVFISNQVWASDNDMLNFGGIYGGRRAMAQLSVANFKLALVQPVGSALGADGDVDYTIPKIEANYVFSADKFKVGVVGGYNAYDVEASTDAGDYDVTSYVVGAFGETKFGPVYVNANVWMGQNVGNYGLYNSGADDAVLRGSTVEDTDSLGFLGVVGFKVSDMLAFEGGYGQVSNDNDTFAQEDETAAFYVQAILKPAKGVTIVPEVGFIDYKENAAGADEGDNTYFGAKWQVDF